MISFFKKLSTSCVVIMMIAVLASPLSTHAATPDELQAMFAKLTEIQSVVKHIQPTPQVLGVSVITVSTDTELLNALKAVKGGETIELAPGNYGAIGIVGDKYSQLSVAGVKGGKSPVLTAPVKITSKDSNNRAIIDRINLSDTAKWTFDNIIVKPNNPGAINASLAVKLGGSDLRIENSWVTYSFEDSDSWDAAKWAATVAGGIGMGGGSNNVAKNNYVSNVYMGIMTGGPGGQVIGNVVTNFSGDGIRALGDNSLIEGNIVKNIRIINGNHPDAFQSWSKGADGKAGTGVVTGITVRKNTFLISENLNHPLAKNMQGIGLFDGDYKDWVIEDNVIMSDTYHGINISGAINVKVDHNTVVNIAKNSKHKMWINVGKHKHATTTSGVNIVSNNLSTALIITTGGTVYNPTAPVSLTKAVEATFPDNNYVIPVAKYDSVYTDLATFNLQLKSPAAYKNAGARVFTDPRATTKPTVPGTTTPVVVNPAPMLTFTAATTSVLLQGSTNLSWSTTNATSCVATGAWSGNQSTNGTVSTGALSPVGTKTYTLTCSGKGGTVNKSVTIQVVTKVVPPIVITPAPTLTFVAAPTSVIEQGNTILTWNATNATSCVATGAWSGTKSTNGTLTTGALTPAGTKTFTLTCSGVGGSVTKSVPVQVVSKAIPKAVINSWIATPSTVPFAKNGQQSIALQWQSSNTSLCTIFEDFKSATTTKIISDLKSAGTYTVTPSWTRGTETTAKQYRLVCRNAVTDGVVEASVLVKLAAATTVTPDAKPVPRFASVRSTATSTIRISAVFGAAANTVTSSTIPALLGYITWGDMTGTTSVTAKITGEQVAVGRSHVYTKDGTYMITLIGLDGTTVTKSATVGTSTATVPGQVLGASTNVYAEINAALSALREMVTYLPLH